MSIIPRSKDYKSILDDLPISRDLVFQRNNVEEDRNYDPVTQKHVHRRKESSQWEHPTGPNQYQQYSKVVDEKTTGAPNMRQCQKGQFEYMTSESGNCKTTAVRSEQKFEEVNSSQYGGRKSSMRVISTVQSFSTRTTTKNNKKQEIKGANAFERITANPESSKDYQKNGSHKTKADALDLTTLEVSAPLDHSFQIGKKNLSKNGSLSRRRRPSRSNLKSNMSQIFQADHVSEIDIDCVKNTTRDLVNFSSNDGNDFQQFGPKIEDLASDKCKFHSTIDKSQIIKQIAEKNAGKLSLASYKEPDLIRDVKLCKLLPNHDDDKNLSGNWLEEAKRKLRKSNSNLTYNVEVMPKNFEQLDIDMPIKIIQMVNHDVVSNGHKMPDDINSVGRASMPTKTSKVMFSDMQYVSGHEPRTFSNGTKSSIIQSVLKTPKSRNSRSPESSNHLHQLPQNQQGSSSKVCITMDLNKTHHSVGLKNNNVRTFPLDGRNATAPCGLSYGEHTNAAKLKALSKSNFHESLKVCIDDREITPELATHGPNGSVSDKRSNGVSNTCISVPQGGLAGRSSVLKTSSLDNRHNGKVHRTSLNNHSNASSRTCIRVGGDVNGFLEKDRECGRVQSPSLGNGLGDSWRDSREMVHEDFVEDRNASFQSENDLPYVPDGSIDFLDSDNDYSSQNQSLDMFELEHQERMDREKLESKLKSFEKNKSKSTSNLDDDETIEAPWFRDPKYQKPSRLETKKFAKSSINLKYSTNVNAGNELDTIRLRKISNCSKETSPETAELPVAPWMSEIRLKSVARVVSTPDSPCLDDKDEISMMPDDGPKNGHRVNNGSATDVTVNGERCRLPNDGCGLRNLSLGDAFKERFFNDRDSNERTRSPYNQSVAPMMRDYWKSSVNDNIVIITNSNSENVTDVHKHVIKLPPKHKSELYFPLSTESTLVHPRKKASENPESGNYDVEAKLPKEELIRRSLIDWDSLDRPKRNVPADKPSKWLQEVKLRRVTQSLGDLISPVNSEHPINDRFGQPQSPDYSSYLDIDSEDDAEAPEVCRLSSAHRILESGKVRETRWTGSAFSEEPSGDLKNSGSIPLYNGDSLKKLEENVDDCNGFPEWIKESVEKQRSWRNLSNSGNSQRSEKEMIPSWLNQVKLKKLPESIQAPSGGTVCEENPIANVILKHGEKADRKRNTAFRWDTGEDSDTTIEAEDEVANEQLDTANFCTSWKYVVPKRYCKSSRCKIAMNGSKSGTSMYSSSTSKDDHLETSVDEASSVDEDFSEDLSNSEPSRSDSRSRNFMQKIEIEHSNFDVESYVRDLISKRKAEGTAKHSLDYEELQDTPDWIEKCQSKTRNIVDWNSLERLNALHDNHNCFPEVHLRRTPYIPKMSTEETRIVAVLRHVQESESEQSDEYTDAMDDFCSLKSPDRPICTDDPQRSTIGDKSDNPEWMQTATKIKNHNVDWSKLEHGSNPSASCSSPGAPWVTQVHLRAPFLRAQENSFCISQKELKPETMPCLTPSQSPQFLAEEEIFDEEEAEAEVLKSNTRQGQPIKRVTFCIPKACSSPEISEESSPEWVKIAEEKCSKPIKWAELEKQDVEKSKHEGRWITQVHLRHVPASLNDIGVKGQEDQTSQLNISLRPVETSLQMTSSLHKRKTGIAGPGTNGQGEVSGQAEVRVNGCNLTSPKNGDVGLAKGPGGNNTQDIPEWMKIAEQKKRAKVDWEKLESKRISAAAQTNRVQGSKNNFQEKTTSEANGTKEYRSVPSSSLDRTERSAMDGTKGMCPLSNGHSRWQSDPQLSASPPSWFQLAEKKKNLTIDWSSIERTPSESSSDISWLQEVRLKRSPSPRICETPEESPTPPFEVQLRHVESRKPEVPEEGNLPWPTLPSSSDVDKWQERYKELFEDLPYEGSTDSECPLPVCSGSPYKVIRRPRSSSASPKKSRTSTLDNRHRRKFDMQHRYYSLPEMSRDCNELEIIHLKRPHKMEVTLEMTPESPLSEEDFEEEQPITFVKLRPTEVRKEEKLTREEVPSWVKEVKLRRCLPKLEESTAEAEVSSVSGEAPPGAFEPSQKPFGRSMPRTVSAPVPVSSMGSIRDAIHRDLKEEVARREMRRSTELLEQEVTTTTTVKSHTLPTRNKPEMEKDQFQSLQQKPAWLEELQKKTTTLKSVTSIVKSDFKSRGAEQYHPQNGAPRRSQSLNFSKSTQDAPSFESVLQQIKSMGKDKRFSGLRKTNCNFKCYDDEEHLEVVQETTKVNRMDYDLPSPCKKETISHIQFLISPDPIPAQESSYFSLTCDKRESPEYTIQEDQFFSESVHSETLLKEQYGIPKLPNGHAENSYSDAKCSSADVIGSYHPVRKLEKINSLVNGNSLSHQPLEVTTLPEVPLINDTIVECSHGGQKKSLVNGNSNKECLESLSSLDLLGPSEMPLINETIFEIDDEQQMSLENGNCNKACLESRQALPISEMQEMDKDNDGDSSALSNAEVLDDLKSPMLLMNLLSSLNRCSSETNLSRVGEPTEDKKRFSASFYRMTSSCTDLLSQVVGQKSLSRLAKLEPLEKVSSSKDKLSEEMESVEQKMFQSEIHLNLTGNEDQDSSDSTLTQSNDSSDSSSSSSSSSSLVSSGSNWKGEYTLNNSPIGSELVWTINLNGTKIKEEEDTLWEMESEETTTHTEHEVCTEEETMTRTTVIEEIQDPSHKIKALSSKSNGSTAE